MRIPVVDVNVPLTWFFVVVPLLILILQIGVLMEHVLLSQKAQEINELLTQAGDRELSDRIKYRASTYFFVQDVISPNHSWLISAGLRIITWVTLEFFPICTLILVQLKFLPYQDGWITGLHRVVIALAALNIIAARISRRKTLSWRNDLKLPLITLASKLIKLLTIPIEPLIAVVLSCFIALGANEKRRFYDFSFIGERIGLFGFGADESTGHTSSVFSQRLYLPEVSLRKGAYGGDYGGTIGTCACGGYSGTPFFQPKFPDHDQANFDTKFFAHLVKACPAYNEVDAKVQAVLSVWSEEVGERGR